MTKSIYLKGKFSNIDWIGNIPEDWDIVKVKNIFYRKKEKAGLDNPTILSLTSKGVIVRDVTKNEGQIAESYYDYNPVDIGDLLLNPMDLVTNAFSSISHFKGVISQAYFNLKNKENIYSNYYDYYFKLQYWSLAFFAHGKGVSSDHRWTLNNETLMNYYAPRPSFKEQQAIANYLDDKTTKIDQTILLKKKQIELLKEKRTAMINKVVMKGLDPDVEIIDSGIEWIGKIPRGWKVSRLKYETKMNIQSLSEKENPRMELLYIDIGNVNIFGIQNEPELLYFSEAPSRARRKVKDGDTILGTVRTYLKAIAYMNNPLSNLIVSTGFAVIEPQEKFNSKYLYYQLLSEIFIQKVVANSKGVSYPAINSTELGVLDIVIPDIIEQKKIIDYLDRETSLIDKTIVTVQHSINLLLEYKHSLISHVVTGKVNVF